MISQSAEYSLRAVLCLADAGTALTTHQIAAATRVPAGYLSKVLQNLARAGIVTSQRGLNGGFTLARAAEELTLLEVVASVEKSRRIGECPLAIPEHALNLCPLHRRLDAAAEAVEQLLGAATIAELVNESRNDSHVHTCPNKEACHARHVALRD